MLEQGKRTETERDGKVDGLLGETAVAVLGPVGERAAHRLLAEGRDDYVHIPRECGVSSSEVSTREEGGRKRRTVLVDTLLSRATHLCAPERHCA